MGIPRVMLASPKLRKAFVQISMTIMENDNLLKINFIINHLEALATVIKNKLIRAEDVAQL
jgi:hypothetical protein